MSIKSFAFLVLLATFAQSSFGCRNPEVANQIILNFYITWVLRVNFSRSLHKLCFKVQLRFNATTSRTFTRFSIILHSLVLATLSFITTDSHKHRKRNLYSKSFRRILVSATSTSFSSITIVWQQTLCRWVATKTTWNNLIKYSVEQNACTIGENLAAALVRLFDNGYEASRVHLVGFSFGSTVWGIAGREVILQSQNRFMIERITGLDPGQIQNIMLPLTGRLNSGDARFVDTIHTEAVGFGDHEARGHVQYFVNGGVSQPHCTSGINTVAQTCSHLFASTIWIESIRATSPIFPSLQCSSWEHFLRNDCNNAPIGNLGVLTSTALRGSYFLRTNLVAPFSRNVPGP